MKSLMKKIWRFLASPSGYFSLGFLLVAGFALGILFWGGFHTALELTNSEKFCTTCHEMRENVFVEYQGSPHQSNAAGVKASCPDCHVPKEWGPKMIRKLQASKELYGHFISKSIWTQEKFEARRIELAKHEWARMKRTDSRECRNCHAFETMDFVQQENRAAANHQTAIEEGKTCIDCHQGIAHDLPEGYQGAYKEVVQELIEAGDIAAPEAISDYLSKQE